MRTEFGSVPAEFASAVEQVRSAALRPEVAVNEMPAPRRIAPHAFALSGDVTLDGQELASGRFILLYDPAGNESWEGTFRCVTFARATVEADMAADPVLPTVGWSWLTESLDVRSAQYVAGGGSVTVVNSETFGAMAEDAGDSQIEVRASWTPTTSVADHAGAWSDLLCAIAGLPPLSPGVVPLRRGVR